MDNLFCDLPPVWHTLSHDYIYATINGHSVYAADTYKTMMFCLLWATD